MHTDRFRVGHLNLGKANALAKRAPLLFDGPLRGERKKFFQLLERLSIHEYSESKNLAEHEEFQSPNVGAF